MNEDAKSLNLPGFDALVTWFGRVPTFHDAEVVSVLLDRSKPCVVSVHAFEITSDVDEQGAYVLRKHAIVTFTLEGVVEATIEGFNLQNVLNDIRLSQQGDGFQLVIDGCYGASGMITAARVRIHLQPGVPSGSQYRKATDSDA